VWDVLDRDITDYPMILALLVSRGRDIEEQQRQAKKGGR
jgi:hypothetical protein